MSQWHYADRNRQQHGPIESAALAQLFREGRLDLHSLVWRDGLAAWQPLGDFAGELGLLEPTAPDVVENAGTTLEPLAPADAATFDEAGPKAPASPYAAPAAALRSDEGFHAGGEVVYAGFWKRVAAYFIDAFVVGAASQIVQMVLMVVLMGIGAGTGSFGSGSDPFGSVLGIAIIVSAYLVPILLQAFYFSAFHASSRQATLGKMAVGIKVADDEGRRISLLRGVARHFASWISWIPLGLGCLMAAFTQRKQALHDLICSTQVVDKWAYTAHPEWQRRELGTATVVILVIAGALTLLAIVFVGAVVGMLAGLSNR